MPNPLSRLPRRIAGARLSVTLPSGFGWIGVLVAVALGASPMSASPQAPGAGAGGVGGGGADAAARIVGFVLEAGTDRPIRGAFVRVRDLGTSDVSHDAGDFHLANLPAGTHTLVVEMLGFAALERAVVLAPGETAEVEIRLTPSALFLPGIVVTGMTRERGVAETYRPTAVLAGEELNRRLGWSLAETLRDQPGIAAGSFGPVTAQPVIRGMGGDRVLVLEDGSRTGDLSSSSRDHAVGVDPIGAERIEVVRGPAGLLYGSNALGGIINVIREDVPRAVPERRNGTASVAGASVNRGLTAAVGVAVPLGFEVAARAEASARTGDDVRTPLGTLPSTDSRGLNLSAGASWIPSWGFVGAAYRGYFLDHGVPGEFQGDTIAGAHPGGATIETKRNTGRFQLGHFAGLGPLASVQADLNLIHYTHREIEGVTGAGTAIVGTTFDQLTATANLSARHAHDPEAARQEGALGAFASFEDLITGGSFPGVRDSRRTNLAAFFHEEYRFGRVRVQAGARYDWIRVEPVDLDPIDTGTELLTLATRTFGDFSASLAGLFEIAPGWILGANVARAFRAPSVKELYSAGPHLADFSYDIGSPTLGTEVGLGTDLFLRLTHPRVNFEGTVFRNRIRNFIHSRPTGELDPRFSRFPLYVSDGADAVFVGADGRVEAELRPRFVVDATASWVRAEYQATGEPLPQIPPVNGSLGARYESGRFFVSVSWDAALRQERVANPIPNPDPGEPDLVPERATDGHGLLHLTGGLRWGAGERGHSLTLGVENVLDAEWRDHLSRTKEVAPEPGRNIHLLYRVTL